MAPPPIHAASLMPRFSVVIPTRERPDTLRCALATCLNQAFDDYEIVVCDNGTSDRTRKVVADIASRHVRHIRAPRSLAMSDNWELGVSEARGEFILLLGDDDGLMPFALAELDRLLDRLRTPVVRWEASFYSWPDINMAGAANYLRLPLRRTLKMLDARSTIAGVLRFEVSYVRLPMLYTAVVHRSLIDRVRKSVGRVFPNRYPDVFSGFALGYLAGRYPSISVPMHIAGSSGSSFGIANLFHRGQSPLDEDFRRLNDEGRLPHHPTVPDLPVFPEVPVADSFQFAKFALFPRDADLRMDRELLLRHCLAALPDASEFALDTLRASAADDRQLSAWLTQAIESRSIQPRPPIKLRPDRLGFDGEALHLDTAAFNVATVEDAVTLADHILGIGRSPIEYEDGLT
jgi:hypothetical protein